MLASKLEERAKTFQRSLDFEEVKRKREEGQVELRKQKRSEQIAKKRALGGRLAVAAEEDAGTFTLDLSLIDPELHRYCPSLSDSSLPPLQHLQSLISLLQHPTTLLKSLPSLTRILAAPDSPPLLCVASAGVIPMLVQLLSSPEREVVYNSAWSLTNLLSGPSLAIEKLLECNGLPALIRLLDHEDDAVVDQAAWTLSNIAGDSSIYRKLVIEAGTAAKVVQLLKRKKTWDLAYVENMVWLLSNLCRDLDEQQESVADTIVPMIPYFLSSERAGVIANACWVLSYLTDNGNNLEKVMSIGVTSRLIDLTLAVTEDQQLPALRVVGNILTGCDSYVQTLLNLGVLEKLMILITNRRREIRKEVLWCYSNIAGGTLEQQKMLAFHHSFGLVLNSVAENDAGLRKEAVYVIANLTRENDEEIQQRLLAQGALERLVRVLEDSAELTTLQVALEGISNILRAAGVARDRGQNEVALRFEAMSGLSRLEALQSHSNEKVYEKVVSMMGEFYGMEEVRHEAEDLHAIPAGGFQFS